jgi:hypothetical protein
MPRGVARGTRGTDERLPQRLSSAGAVLPLVAALLTVTFEALYGSPLQHERVEAVPEIGRQCCRIVAQLVHLLDRCAQPPLEGFRPLLSAPVHMHHMHRAGIRDANEMRSYPEA